MSEESNDKRRMTFMLLQESLWKVEDKLSLMMESIADHEAELIRLRRLVTLTTQRIHTLGSRISRSKSRKSSR